MAEEISWKPVALYVLHEFLKNGNRLLNYLYTLKNLKMEK